jgi:UDP-glucose 4-epimerase
MKVLVTGAGGFLGRRVVAALQRSGHAVRALVRTGSGFDAENPDSLELFRADLTTAENIAAAFEGVDVLIHLAAAVTGDEARMFAATVGGTERLLAAMAASGCRRIVLASTFAVYDWSAIESVLDEDSPLETERGLPYRDGYARAKFHQEQLTRRLAAEHSWDLTVLRPGYVWGRGKADIEVCCLSVGALRIVIGPATRLPLTHVENCADLFARAATDARAIGKTFNVVDGPGERIWTYLKDHLRLSGEAGFPVPLPYRFVSMASKAMYAAGLKRWEGLPGLLIPRRLEARLKPLLFSNRRVREQLEWLPPLGYSECMALTYSRTPTA